MNPKIIMTGEIQTNLINVQLTEKDAELFLSFRENQTEFMILKNIGVFDFKAGNMCIHKDEKGIVRKVEMNTVLFKV